MKRISTFACAYGLCCAVVAQDVAWATWGNANIQVDGNNAVVGDVNHDGHEDIALICDGRCNAMFGTWGYVRMLSGRDGAVLYEIPVHYVGGPGPYFRDISPAGDWNHDGTPDFATMQVVSPQSHFVVHDGATGNILFMHPAVSLEIVADCDVDGDGWNDFILADNVLSVLGRVRVYSHTGALLYQLNGTAALYIGLYVATVGDVDDDGADDFVMTGQVANGYGASVVVSGRTGTYLRTCYGELPWDNIRGFVQAAGDWDGDGYQEFVVAGWGGARAGCAVFSARTGQLLRGWYSVTSSTFGQFVAGRGIDYDGDGFPDIIAGDPLTTMVGPYLGGVYVLSGRDGSTIHTIPSQLTPAGSGRIGLWVNGLRPGPGNHVGTIIAPDKQATLVQGFCPTGPIESLVHAYRGLPRTSQVLSDSCRGNLSSAPDLGLQTTASGAMRVHLSDAPPSTPAVLLLGAVGQHGWVPTPLALDPIGLPGCSLWGPIDVMALVAVSAPGPNIGYANIDLPLAVPLQGIGTWWVSAQWLVLGTSATFPGGMTQAVRWRR